MKRKKVSLPERRGEGQKQNQQSLQLPAVISTVIKHPQTPE